MTIYTYTTLNDPSATTSPGGDTTYAQSINHQGRSSGITPFGTETTGVFLYSNGAWTSLADPSYPSDGLIAGGNEGSAMGINDSGQIVGYYSAAAPVRVRGVYPLRASSTATGPGPTSTIRHFPSS